ncbi:hypothetical protein AGMMS50262_16250 [Bacteroidia bacterium]|nr:hypothetical protein AGMMS50262_16250 [Bacteroidia bacterium]
MNMKKIIFAVLAVLTFGLNACYDEKMEWNDSSYGNVAAKDLPLGLQEAISRYEVLNAYTEFKLGVGIDFNLYLTDETYRNIVNQNFDEITPGNELKQDALMKNDGTLDFSKADTIIKQLKATGLTIYGHTLVWHSQQKAGYLNSLIAPEVIPSPGESMLDVNALLDNSFTEWNRNNAGGITIVEGAGLSNSEPAIRFEVTTAGNEWDTQLTSPNIPAIIGHAYRFSFWVKSEDAGQARVSFAGMENNYPWVNGGALFSISGAWTQITYDEVWDNGAGANVPFRATANNIKMAFDMGKVPGVYYVDINSISVIDLDAGPAEINLVTNGNFESGELDPWTTPNLGAGIEVSEEAKYTGTYGLKAVSSATSKNEWDLQFQTPEIVVDKSKSYTVSFMIKSDVEGSARISYSGFENNYPWTDWDGSGGKALFSTSSTWKEITYTLPTDFSGDPKIKISFDLGKLPDVTYYIDDVKVVEEQTASSAPRLKAQKAGPTIIEKTPEEKKALLEPVFINYITGVATHFAGKVAAWDVVNEPMNENGTLRAGEENLQSTSAFYWQYYLGKDYAVTAFKLAKAADPNAKLFINDYNLESASGSKLDGLLEYVNYIEDNGGAIDGIGTQMHLNVNWIDTVSIKAMFQKLATTGKLIKISELDIAISSESNPANPVAPTAEQYARQAELYRAVADLYTRIIPKDKQYGITVWGVSDNEKEHEYWLKNDAPCLWNADYARKHAYKGLADGLAGKDVSADFSGELEY